MTRAKRAAGALTLCLLLLACCLCAAGCTEEKTEEPPPGVTLTALEQTYTGEALYPVVTVTPTDLSDVRLKFYRDGEEVSAMVDAGEYRVVAEVQNGAIPDEEAEFVIRKATIDLAAVELPAKQYDGTTAYAATVAKLPGAGKNAVSLEIEGRLSAAEGEQVRLAVTKIALTGEDAANFELGSVEALYVRVIKN